MIFEFLKHLQESIDEKLQQMSRNAVTKPMPKPNIFTAPAHPVAQLDIPQGTEVIPRGAMAGRKELVSVSVPASVKVIRERAFAGCENLARVTLCEGLEQVEDDVFSGCKRLTSIVIPNSVTRITGSAFSDCGVTEPVLNAAGDTLIYCPAQAAGEEYTVPEGVRRIRSHAFFKLPGLKQVHFPESLERIDKMAFALCGLTWVSLSRSAAERSRDAFFGCKDLCAVKINDDDDRVRSTILGLHVRGQAFLKVENRFAPPNDPYWLEPDFRALADSCAAGNVDAMERMVRFFDEKSHASPDEPFYTGAANFWRVRAFENGSKTQREWLSSWLEALSGKRLSSACLTEKLEGTVRGSALNALGFLFFEPDRVYSLAGLDGYGVVEASAYESEDGPDEDGFGREIYFDWWYLDGDLRAVPGVDCLHSYSSIDRRISDVRIRFEAAHAAAAKAVMARSLRRRPGI